MEGKEDFILTGQLGDVMRESARAGLSWSRANAARLGVERELFEKNTMHIHVPAGAIPKDGPSAGITMVTAMVSSLTGIPVRKDVAMTGEITLRGRVLPIGGLKSKILAAHLSGAKIVIIPKRNEKDLRDIPDEVRSQMKLVLVENMDQVLAAALRRRPRPLQALASQPADAGRAGPCRAGWHEAAALPAAAAAGGGLTADGGRMEYRDYYATLGPSTRTPARPTIKKAFRRLAREHHPDVNKDEGRRAALQGDQRGQRGPLRSRRSARPTTSWGPTGPATSAPCGRRRPVRGAASRWGAGPGGVRFEFHGDPRDALRLQRLLPHLLRGRRDERPRHQREGRVRTSTGRG